MRESTTQETVEAASGVGLLRNMSGRTRMNLIGSLVLALLIAVFCVTNWFMPHNADAWPTKYGSCSASGCHVQIDPNATITTAINGVVGTSVTVAPGGTFEVDWKVTNVTNAAAGQVGVGVEINLPTGWGLAKGTVNSPAIPGWNAVWDAADGVPAGWATANSYSATNEYPASPVGYTINYDTTAWDTGNRNAAFDNASAGDRDGIADNMGADAIVTVPAGTANGTYTIVVLGVGHDSSKSHVEQAITVTVSSGGGGDTTKPVVTAGFAATNPATTWTIPVSGFAATDNTGVTGYMITTSATAPLAGAAGWTATAPTSYTVTADGSYTLYPWAKDAAGNVSAVYASPVTVLVDSVHPSVSSTVPTSGATGITPDSTVTLNFSEAVNCATVTTTSVTIVPAVTWTKTSCSGSQAIFTPTGQAANTPYTVTAGTGITDSVGNAMNSSYPFSYTTATAIVRPDTAISAPAAAAVLSTSPAAITGSATAGTNALGSVQVSTNNGSTWSAATGTSAWSFSWTLPAEDYVTHTILAKAVDSASNEDTTPASVTVIVDTVAPTGLTNTAPANLATNQALTTSLSSGTATDANTSAALQYFFELATDSGFTTGVQQSGWQTTRTFAPTLTGGTTYYWHVRAKDAAGNTSAYTTTWSFSTIAPTAPNVPSASQYQADGSTAIAQAGTATSTSVVVKSAVTDVNGDNVTLQVEMITNANTFSGTPNCSSVAVASGSTASATCTGLTDGLAYKWRARTTDGTLNSAWVDFGASNPDFTVTVPNTTPAAPTALAQYQADGTTAITTGGTASSNVVVIGATVDGGNADPVLLEVDLNNDGIADCASPYVTGPATAKAICNGLADGSYDWRVRAKDSKAVASAWTAFTGTPDFLVSTGLDFGVDTTPPTDGIASATSGDGYITVSWTAATDSGAGLDPLNTYKLVKSSVSTPADCSAAALYTGNGTSYFDSAVANGSTYYYRVCALDEVANLSAGVTVSGSPSTIALPETTITAPAANTVVTTGPVSITGGTSAGANPVASVQVSTNNGTTWAAATGTAPWSFTWAPPTEDYVAHTILAKGVDSLGYADATPAQVVVRVDNVAPANVANATPANLATNVALTTSLTSATATDANTSAALQYFFEVATDNTFTTGVQQSGWQTAKTFAPTLASANSYYWHVRAMDAAGNISAYSTTWSFSTIGQSGPDAPVAAQYQADGTTAIAQAGTATGSTVVIKAPVSDPNGDNVTLQVEMITNGNAFAGVANCSSIAVTSGSTASAACSGLTDGLSYKWRARTTDGTYNSAWVDFGGSDPDFAVSFANATPAAPTALAQFQADGTTAIASGAAASTNVVVIGATVDGGNGDSVLLEVDLNNDGIADCASPYVTGPATAQAVCGGLADGSFDWRVRAKDGKGAISAWTSFTGTPDFTVGTGLDFAVDTTPPTDGSASDSSGDGYIKISWSSASDAGAGLDPVNTYKVVKSSVSTPADCSGTALYSGNGTSYFDNAVVNGTTYYYRVCALDEVGNLSAGTTISGSASAIALPDTTISAPAANAVITTGPVSITGAASAGANPLASVQVSTNNGTTWAAASGTTSWSFTWAPSTEDYVAHTILAKGVDSLGYADATPAQVTVRVDNVAPAGLNNSAPANLAPAVALNSVLTSTSATDGNTSAAVQYFFEIATNSGFTTGVQQSGWQAGTSFAPTLAPGTQYFWHVMARDAAGNTTAYTTTWSFTSSVVAPETVLSVPAAGTVFSTSPAAISGTATAGTNALGSIQVSVNNGTSWNTAAGTGTWSYSWTLPAEDYVAHTILARAVDNASNADPTPASVSVYVDTVAPTGFANSTPANLATSVATTTSLTTTAATDANTTAPVQYFFEVATDSGFTTGVQQSTWQTGLSFAPTLAYGTTYYWHLRTKDAAGNISAYSTTTSFTTAAAVTTVGQGTGEISLTIAPGATEIDLDTFTLATQAGTDTVAGLTVTLANGTWAGIASINVTDDTGTTVYGTANPASNTVAITLTTPITVTTTPTQYVLVIKAKTAVAMPAPPGASYAVTGTVTAITSSNPKSYGDTASATVTIDNLSPANVTSAGGAAGVASNSLYWTNPADSDFAGIVVLRRSGSAVTDTPVEGTNYLTGSIIGSSTVAYAGSLNNFVDAPLTNGTVYYYKIFAVDARGNYTATGVAVGPYTPVRTAWANSPMLHTSTTTGSTKWSANGGWGEPGKKYGAFTCATCHNMSTPNIMRAVTSVATGDGSNWATNNSPTIAVSYLNPATDKGNDSTHATSNRICEVCHSQTSFHKYNNPTANHNGTVNCTQCHSHNAGFKGSGGSCLLCHNSPRGVRQQVVGATLGSTGDDFVRPSRHIKNTTVKNVDCIICHAEGDTTSTETSVKQVSLHGTSGAPVLLRNVDSQGNPGTAGTNYWSWPGRRAGGTAISSTDRDNMDRFCVNCHDSDGASTITVDTAGTAITTGTALARKLTPFNPLDGGTPLNVKSQFNSGMAVGSAYASHHNLNIYTKRYTAAYASTYASRGGWTGTSKDNVAMTWDTGLHCSDCHLNESNAHGARNATRMLQDKNGADAAATNASDGSATFICYRCHLSTVYNNTNVTVTGKARIEHNSLDNVPWTVGSYNDHGIICLNCHMGGGVNNIGGIHGNNRSITTLTQGATKSYRFIYGAELGLNISDANWSTTTAPTCYTASSTWGGACNKHDGSAGTGRIGTPNYARPLQ
ncbi:Ig-like domain-containing protein [Geomonas subterranea]|uniref:Ig-like domain-containing protein n=1 Tax=Geomonas subterranea TaxID=2847989 RepID=UPI001CD6F4A3|nr:Ig-like domain-containing protein [Geomonas fuzhouensis]